MHKYEICNLYIFDAENKIIWLAISLLKMIAINQVLCNKIALLLIWCCKNKPLGGGCGNYYSFLFM